ncbi:MAG: LysR family transcriptional regulator [Pseudomonadota bacterium]
MDRFEAMRSLLAAVDAGSLSAAARRTHVPLPTLSRRIADLETHLGAPLLIRTSRKLHLTEAGEAFVTAARRLLDDLDEAERAAAGEYRAPRGELVVTAPLSFGRLHVAPVIHGFLAAYPEVDVRMILADHVIDLAESHVDVGVRIGRLPDSDLMARKLGDVSWVICGSPDYLSRRGVPGSPGELLQHDCVVLEGLPTARAWLVRDGGQERAVAIEPRFTVNSADAVVEAALGGVGLARVVSYQAAAALARGDLVPVLRRFWSAPFPVHLVHRSQRQQPLKVRAFLDYIFPRLSERLITINRAVQ